MKVRKMQTLDGGTFERLIPENEANRAELRRRAEEERRRLGREPKTFEDHLHPA